MVRLQSTNQPSNNKKPRRSNRRNPWKAVKGSLPSHVSLFREHMTNQQSGIQLPLNGQQTTTYPFTPLILALPLPTTQALTGCSILHDQPLTFTSILIPQLPNNQSLPIEAALEGGGDREMVGQETRGPFEGENWPPYDDFSFRQDSCSEDEMWLSDINLVLADYDESFNMDSPYFDETVRRRAMGLPNCWPISQPNEAVFQGEKTQGLEAATMEEGEDQDDLEGRYLNDIREKKKDKLDGIQVQTFCKSKRIR